MKWLGWFSIFFLLSFVPAAAQPDKDSIQGCIARFFDGLSDVNINTLRAYSTPDFLLLEQGEIWNMDTLVNKLSGRNPQIKRTNSFKFIQTEQAGNVAWVSYHNTAVFRLNEKQQIVRWLESAVLRKEKGRWKIKLLHSTRLKDTE